MEEEKAKVEEVEVEEGKAKVEEVEVEEEKADPWETVHHKYNVGVTNWGPLRNKGEMFYAKNLYNLSVFIALTMECQEGHVRQVEGPHCVWKTAEHRLAVDQPAQGFEQTPCAGGEMKLVKRWKCSEIFHGLCVVGRCSRVESLQVLDKFVVERKGKCSKLMLVQVTWRVPMGGATTTNVIVGHLHNELAKTTKAEEMNKFWNRLAHLCAGGGGGEGRLIGMDANMAMFGVIPEMAKRGVGLTLLCHHYELADPENTKFHSLKWDSLGLWIVGPVDIEKCKRLCFYDHLFWGASHPKSFDIALRNYQCGYFAESHCWPTPFQFSALAETFKKPIDKVREEVVWVNVGDQQCRADFGVAPWNPVEMPKWFGDSKARLEVWQNQKIDFFCAGGSADNYTYLHKEGKQTKMSKTDDLPKLPGSVEVMAQAWHWDPFGCRWGRGSHWPLLASIGTKRYRSLVMQEKRAWKQWKKPEGSAASGSGSALAGPSGLTLTERPRVTLTPAPGVEAASASWTWEEWSSNCGASDGSQWWQ